MVRTMFAWSVVVLVGMTAGCRMCASPYDYCRPTFTGECGQGCFPNAREGSILSHGFQPVSGSELMVPVPGEVIRETDEVVVEGDDVVSTPEEGVEPEWANKGPLVGAQPILMPQRTARSWHAVQR